MVSLGVGLQGVSQLMSFFCKTTMSAMNRKRESGTVLHRKMLKNMFGAIFQQDGAPAHNAKVTRNWLRRSVNGFGRKVHGQLTL